jgi:transcriptional regulator with XRE-family HTH domain
MGVRTITDGLVLTLPKPIPGYPLRLTSIGDHLLRRRLDLGLTRKDAARQLRADPTSLKNWERGNTEVKPWFYPAIIQFLEYNPLPEGQTRGRQIERERMTRGWSRKRLAREAGVDEGTVTRLEADRPGTARKPAAAICKALGVSA